MTGGPTTLGGVGVVGVWSSNSTSVPFAWMAGIWVLSAASFNGFSSRDNHVSCVSPMRADISEMLLSQRSKYVSRVSPASRDTSEMLLSKRYNSLRFVACSSPVRFVIPSSEASRDVRLLIVFVVIVLPISCWIAALKFGSGMRTTVGWGCGYHRYGLCGSAKV